MEFILVYTVCFCAYLFEQTDFTCDHVFVGSLISIMLFLYSADALVFIFCCRWPNCAGLFVYFLGDISVIFLQSFCNYFDY